jgi:hypothetical protein
VDNLEELVVEGPLQYLQGHIVVESVLLERDLHEHLEASDGV